MSWGNSMLSRYPVPITVKLSGELFLTGTDSRLILSLGHASSRSISLFTVHVLELFSLKSDRDDNRRKSLWRRKSHGTRETWYERSWIGRRQVLYERDSRCSARATTERAPVVTTNPFHWRCSCVPVSKVPPSATTGSRGACAVSPRPLSSLLSCHCTARTGVSHPFDPLVVFFIPL